MWSKRQVLLALSVLFCLAVSLMCVENVMGVKRLVLGNPLNYSVSTINNREQTEISVRLFGAKGDGISDDTAAIQAAVDVASVLGGNVAVPPGTYLVNAKQSIRLKSGVALCMTQETILKAIPNDAESYAVLLIEEVSDVSITGGVILGDRMDHIGETGQWGMGISITGSKNIIVQNTKAINCWGDGFYVGAGKNGNVCENISLIDIKADNNRRQGLSLICGRNVQIIRPQLTNTKGQAPEAGIDIEPNKNSDILENIIITDPATGGNNGAGISVSLSQLAGTTTPVSINIVNHRDNGSDRGMMIFDRDILVPGVLTVESPEWVNSKNNGLAILNHHYLSFAIDIISPKIVNANKNGSKYPNTGSAIAIYHNVGLKDRTGGIGNVRIDKPLTVCVGTETKTVTSFWVSDIPEQETRNLIIKDPIVSGDLVRVAIPDAVKPFIH